MTNKNKKEKQGVVYSTNPSYDYSYNQPDEPDTLEPKHQVLYTRKEVRNGKPCVVIKEFVGTEEDLKSLAKQIKVKLGTGGSAKDNEIVIQGDVLLKVKDWLQNQGYKTKG